MKFYLGTHLPNWLNYVEVPLFISARRLNRYKKMPKAVNPWCLDSGGFSELSLFGEWKTTVSQYVENVQRFQESGKLVWCAPQDWMCEPWIIQKTGLTVEIHQQKTVENYLILLEKKLPVIPVLQGWTQKDYENCYEMYVRNGVKLEEVETVGLGSVCRRQATNEIGDIAKWGHSLGIKLHGFGVKAAGLHKYGEYLQSADSLAWSFSGRFDKNRNCPKNSCSNCLHYALEWREKLIASFSVTPVR